jgi:SAM-dependent methyltransferase
MSVDHYAGAQGGWAGGAALVYGPIARRLVGCAPHSLGGRLVLDVGAGTGVAGGPLADAGARPLSTDLSWDMLAHNAPTRPPAAVADVRALPLADRSVDDVLAAFVLNHLSDPGPGLLELARVTRPGGAVLACVYANANNSPVRDLVDATARAAGWRAPEWYVELKARAAPVLGTAEAMRVALVGAGLERSWALEEAVDVGVTEPEQLVDYRLGQAPFAQWLAALGARRAAEVRLHAMEEVSPVMAPYRPIVVFGTALVR